MIQFRILIILLLRSVLSLDKIFCFEYSTGAKALDDGVYEYKVDGKKIIKIDFPDNNGFVAIHKKNNETEYIKSDYMKFCTRK